MVAVAAALMLVSPVVSVGAQNLGVVQSQIVTVDSEKIFASAAVGQRITRDLEDRVAALAAENKRIAAELEAEELDLTERRKTIEPAEFRLLANEFDEKVQRIRAEQDAKQRELQRLRDAERLSFIDTIGPIISRIAQARGALIVLERRNVLLSADSIDITQQVIDTIDAALAEEIAPPPDGSVRDDRTDGASGD